MVLVTQFTLIIPIPFNNIKNALIVDNYTTKLSIKWLKCLLWDTPHDIKKVFELPKYDFENYDLIVLSWWLKFATDPIFDNIKDQIRNNLDKKIIWTCLGYQIMWLAHDASSEYVKLHTMENELRGIYEDVTYIKRSEPIKVHRLHKRILKVYKEWPFDVLWHSIHWHDIIKHVSAPHIWFSFHPHIYIDETDWEYIFHEALKIIDNI